MNMLAHARNELGLRLYLARRYWLESVSGFVLILGSFVGLLHAVIAAGEMSIHSERLNGLILGFVLWMYAGTAYSSTSSEVAEEIRARSLEQLCMGPLPLWRILAIRAILHIAGGTLILLLSFTVIAWLGREELHLLDPAVLGIVLLAAPSLLGFGYMVAGVLLVIRKMETLQLLVYPGLIALIALPVYPLNGFAALPFAYGASAARFAVGGGALGTLDFIVVASNSLGWLMLGIVVFKRFEREARRLGVMGHG